MRFATTADCPGQRHRADAQRAGRQGDRRRSRRKTEAAIADAKKALEGSDIEAIKSSSEALQSVAYELAQIVYADAQQASGAADGAAAAGDDDVVDADFEVVDDDKDNN